MGGGGSTSTMGAIAPELRKLYIESADALVNQQGANPLGQYNDPHALGVAGANPLQQYGAGMMMGGNLPTGLDGLALQSILRSPGLAGAGPTTGAYNYGSESGLQDMMAFLNPQYGTAPGLDYYARSTPGQGYENVSPMAAQQGPYDQGYNLSDILRQSPPSPGGGGGGFQLPTNNNGGPASPSWAGYGALGGPQGQAGPGSSAAQYLSQYLDPKSVAAAAGGGVRGGSGQGYFDTDGRWREIMAPGANGQRGGAYQPGKVFQGPYHQLMVYGSDGIAYPMADQKGTDGTPGKLYGRPSDPAAAAAYDQWMDKGGVNLKSFSGSSTPNANWSPNVQSNVGRPDDKAAQAANLAAGAERKAAAQASPEYAANMARIAANKAAASVGTAPGAAVQPPVPTVHNPTANNAVVPVAGQPAPAKKPAAREPVDRSRR